jgi:ABC-type glycerol-3-phosphate transport system substrate-binding protein
VGRTSIRAERIASPTGRMFAPGAGLRNPSPIATRRFAFHKICRTLSSSHHPLPRIVLLLIVSAAALTGCDLAAVTVQPSLPTAELQITAEPQPTEALLPGITPLVFWEPFALDRSQGLLLGEMIHDFEAENPDIQVEIVPKSGYVGIHSAMLAELSPGETAEPPSNGLPDLSVAFPSMIAEYARAGVVVSLDPYMNDSEVGLTIADLSAIPPGFLDAGRLPGFGGQMMALPFAQNAVGMWVNETLLRQAGWDHPPATWDEFAQACFDVVAQTGVGCYPFVESVSTFNAWLYSRGGQQLDDAGQKAMFNSPAGVESLAFLRRLIDAGVAWRPQEPYGDYVAFANGQAAFTFSSTGNSRFYVDAYEAAVQGGMPPFVWHQVMIPQANTQEPATDLYGAGFFIVQGDPERQRAAWRLIRWFTDTQQTARWASSLEAMPVRISALAVMTDTLAAYPFVEVQVEDILPYSRPEPAVPAELEIRDILYTAILSVTQGYSDPQTALDEAARDVDIILANEP